MNKATLSATLLLLCASLCSNSMDTNYLLAHLYNPYTNGMMMANYPYQPTNTHNNSFFYHNFDLPAALFLSVGSFGFLGLRYAYNKFFTNTNTPNQITNNQPKNIPHQLWITTRDNQKMLLNFKKDLPKSGLRILLKKYSQHFSHHNNEQNPLNTAYSFSEYQLLTKATEFLNNNMSLWKFTPEQQITLLAMASTSKMRSLYLTLIDPTIQTNIIKSPIEISNEHLLPILSMINKETFAIDSKIAMFATHSIHSKDKSCSTKYKHIQDRYIKHKTLTETVLYNAKTQHSIMEIPDDALLLPFPHKKLILIMSIKTNTLFIYDIKKKKKYYLLTTSLQGCQQFHISPDENYIATFSGTNSRKKYDESLIYLWDISDIENIKCHKPLYHRNVSILAFSPNGKTLISGANNNSVALWNLEELSDEDILSKPLIMNDTIDDIIFNNDGTTLAIKHSSSIFAHFITLIDTATLQKQMLFAFKKQPCLIFPDNSNLIMYSTYDEECKQFMFKITTEKNINLYTKILPKENVEYRYSCVISNNNQYVALNFSDQQKFDLLTIDSDFNVSTKTIDGECDYINNDGSFYTHTLHTIDLCNTTTNHRATICHAPQKLITEVNIMPNKKCMTYSYYTDNKKKLRAYKKLLNEEVHKNIKLATKTITPLQYMLINKACNETRKHKEYISIPHDSLNHHIVQSFGEHEKMMSKALRLQITDK